MTIAPEASRAGTRGAGSAATIRNRRRRRAAAVTVAAATLWFSTAAHADCSAALPDAALAGSELETLAPGSSILFWGDSVTARGGDNTFGLMLVRVLNASFERFCDNGAAASDPSLIALMRGRLQRKSYRSAQELGNAVDNLRPAWVVVQDAGEAVELEPDSGPGFGDDVAAAIDEVFAVTDGTPPEPVVKALFLLKTPPLDEPGRDPFVCKEYASACNWTGHNVVLGQVARAADLAADRRVVAVDTDVDACRAMAIADVGFAGDGVHPDRIGYLVYALSLLRGMGVEPATIPTSVLLAQGFTIDEVDDVRTALATAVPANHPRCAMDPSCEPLYLAPPTDSHSALACLAFCGESADGAPGADCRPAFRDIASCCKGNGECVHDVAGPEDCDLLDGDYDFFAAVGACCTDARGCLPEASPSACVAEDGSFDGAGTRCAGNCCVAGPTCPGCGNGLVEDDEECDDGNLDDGDCCSSRCTLDADGADCDDGLFCNGADNCAAGQCTVHAGDPCDGIDDACAGPCNEDAASCNLPALTPCDDAACASEVCGADTGCSCDGAGNCSLAGLCPLCAGLRSDCADPGRSKLVVRSMAARGVRSVAFASAGLPEVDLPIEVGNPVTTDGQGLALCVYIRETAEAPATLLWQHSYPAGETCGDDACWQDRRGQLSYARATTATKNTTRLKTVGAGRRLRASVKATGPGLDLPDDLPVTGSSLVTVQLLAQTTSGDASRCWQETFDEGVLRAGADIFVVRTSR
jgi:hypothetical protein